MELDGLHSEVGFLVKGPNWEKNVADDRFVQLAGGQAEVWLKSEDPQVYLENPDAAALTYENIEAKVNFKNYDKSNGQAWTLLAWSDEMKEDEAIEYKFVNDGQSLISTIQMAGKEMTKLNFKIVKREDGTIKLEDFATRVISKFDEDGRAQVWVNEGEETLYTDEETANIPLKITSFKLDSFTSASVKLNKATDIKKLFENGYSIEPAKKVKSIKAVGGSEKQSKSLLLEFEDQLDIDQQLKLEVKTYPDAVSEESLQATSSMGRLVTDPKFDEKYYYDGQLGPIYTSEKTEFKLWAPTAERVDLITFEDGEKAIPMEKQDKGVYSATVEGDKLGLEYMYDVYVDGSINRVVDPYVKAATINGERGVVANPKSSSVERPQGKDMKNPIIYELHVRDYSIAENSGIKNKGKFLGVVEENTKADNGQATGLDYLKSLGITHVQFLPIYDYSANSVDERNPEKMFNWGYDPVNYNVPEGSYSTDASNPFKRIEELQAMVDKLHENNIGVIMDVVYNHVFSPTEHSFDKIVPGYYFRQGEDGKFLGGTGVGNETASERKMMRKFIVDSTKYWLETYKLDGFRFDLMGTHDYETMNIVYEELSKINPNVIVLGEGWNMDMGLAEDKRATQLNAEKMPNIAFFNDDIRDGIKGSVFDDAALGFVQGKTGMEKDLLASIKGGEGLKSYTSPQQLIQYVEAHDNLTLWDKLKISYSRENEESRLKRHKLATSMVLFSEGKPFLHAGQEFARTKGGDHNSYKSPDSVNQLDWIRADKYSDNVDYVRELIKIRKDHPIFNLSSYEDVNKSFKEVKVAPSLIAYELSDGKEDLIVVHNANNEVSTLELGKGNYKVLVKNQMAKAGGLEEISVKEGEEVKVDALSTLVLVSNSKSTEMNQKNKNGGIIDENTQWKIGLGVGIIAAILLIILNKNKKEQK